MLHDIPGWFGGSPKNCDSICPDLPGGTEEPEGNPPISASGLREPGARSVRAAAELRTEHLKRQTRSLESGHLLLQGLKPSTALLLHLSLLQVLKEKETTTYLHTIRSDKARRFQGFFLKSVGPKRLYSIA